jgi:hypothetical protein
MTAARRAQASVGLILAGILASITPGAGAAETVAAERTLPASTFVLLKFRDVSQLKTAFAASQSGQLFADPAMQPLKDKFASLFEKPDEQVRQALGVSVAELLELPTGQVALALVTRDDPKLPVALLATIDAGENAQRMADVLEKGEKLAEEQGAQVGTEEAGGTTLHLIRQKENEDTPPLVWARVEGTFHVSTDVDALKDLLDHAKGRDDSLASIDNFKKITEKVGADAQVLWFADVSQVLSLITRVASNNGANGEQIAAQLQLIGINGLKAVGGSFAFNEGEFDSVSRVFIYAPGPAQGILKMFRMPPADLRPQPWVPATVASYGTFSFDFDAFWSGLNELVDQFAPGVLDQVQKGLAEADGGGLDIKRDLITPLGQRVTAISDFKKPVTETSQRLLFAVALDDAQAAQASLNKILDMAKASPKKRNFQGTTIYDFDLPAEAAASGITGPISLAIAKDCLFIATEPTLLEQVLRGGGEPLLESREYQEVARHFPSTSSSLGFDRPEDQVRQLYSLFGSDQFKQALEQMRAQNPDAPPFHELFDPKLLPEFDAIVKYLAPSGSYGSPGDDGMLYTSFTLRKSK